MKKPRRAHEIILKAGADTADGLAQELRFLASEIERGNLSTGGIGGPTAGSLYSYTHDPAMTHERYFEEIDKELARVREEREG